MVSSNIQKHVPVELKHIYTYKTFQNARGRNHPRAVYIYIYGHRPPSPRAYLSSLLVESMKSTPCASFIHTYTNIYIYIFKVLSRQSIDHNAPKPCPSLLSPPWLQVSGPFNALDLRLVRLSPPQKTTCPIRQPHLALCPQPKQSRLREVDCDCHGP